MSLGERGVLTATPDGTVKGHHQRARLVTPRTARRIANIHQGGVGVVTVVQAFRPKGGES
ncbi:MAG TPA: hypothetical protein VFV05_17915 [Methylomirabilota bacterium]|nr:hypothetical protein [Methylomirabilota bacterium]